MKCVQGVAESLFPSRTENVSETTLEMENPSLAFFWSLYSFRSLRQFTAFDLYLFYNTAFFNWNDFKLMLKNSLQQVQNNTIHYIKEV